MTTIVSVFFKNSVRKRLLIAFYFVLSCLVPQLIAQDAYHPRLDRVGNRYELVVNDQPFLMLAGETGNSTATTRASMKSVWLRMNALNLNTLIVPVYWELLEPEEGRFDFTILDELISDARTYNLKLVLMWFGSWKNSMSSHVPSWVKLDTKRFPRALSMDGVTQEILSPFSVNNRIADMNAYVNLVNHIKLVDSIEHTVVLLQVENEIGMLPSARDYCKLANHQFAKQVPIELINYMVKNENQLNPEFSEVWKSNGRLTKGTWEEVFGKGVATDELFMAWYFSQYVDQISSAGKAVYPIPTYVNAALNRKGRLPGEYPSAGPLPHVMDVWRAGSPSVDFYSPDFYNPDFKYWNDLYVRQNNPLFIPEHVFDETVAAKALYALGHYEALGFSPFAIEQNPMRSLSEKEERLAAVYALLAQVKPLLDEQRGKGRVDAVLLSKEESRASFVLGDYEFTAVHTYNLGWEPNAGSDDWSHAAAVIIQTDDDEFFYVGFGVSLTFRCLNSSTSRVGILKAESGSFVDSKWVVFQHLNGDQTHQGRHIRSFVDEPVIQRFKLYVY